MRSLRGPSLQGGEYVTYRALALKRVDGFLWFWIGDHKSYEELI
jgi:hypothetical protein